MNAAAQAQKRALAALIVTLAAIFAWSAIQPHDYFTWFLEVWPAATGVVILAATYPRFRFTTLVYGMVWAHAVVLLVGGHYTYAEVPLFDWVRARFHLARNDYDRVGHFAQGFVPALVAREVLIRRNVVRGRGWLSFIVVCICLAISATYELLEWGVGVVSGSAADASLGTQGDPWDTQEDMAMALVGAVSALLLVGRAHDRQIERIAGRSIDHSLRGGPLGQD